MSRSARRRIDNLQRQESGHWQISPTLRQSVSFREHNLLHDSSGLGQFDVILCRNVLSGMDKSVRGSVSRALAERLAPGGLVLTGDGEALTGLHAGLEPSELAHCAWRMAPAGRASAAA